MRINLSEEKNRNSFKKVLVVQTAFIGDVILITPLVREIKKLFPESSIDILLTPETSAIMQNNPYVDSIIIFDKRNNKIRSFIKTLRIIFKNKYDIAFSPHSSITTGLLLLVSGIPVRVGFARWLAKKLLTHKVYNIGQFHKIEKNLRLLTPITDQKFSHQTELFPSDEMMVKAKEILSKLNGDLKKVIAIAPGSNWFTKRWPKENYEKLINKLVNKNYGIVFIGSKEERELCQEINPNQNSLNLAGELSILESAAVIKNCDLMICNDSGALHIANAVETDVFAFFGPTVKDIGYYPIRENDVVLEVDLECRPCSTHGENSCRLGHHNCMQLIKPEFVADSIETKFS